MRTANSTGTPRSTLNLRLSLDEQRLIDRAAESTGKTRSSFVLEAARRAAEEALLDRTLMVVGPDAYDEFVRRLDEPPQPNARLRQTLQRKAPWQAP